MQVAHRSHVFSMKDAKRLREVVELEKPDLIVPEIEAIATQTLCELEKEGFNVVPTARATLLTMDREGIRRLAAEELASRRHRTYSPTILTNMKLPLKKLASLASQNL